ncbi:sigma-70 family RNA polymerase sigma factor [Clostridium sp. P21]|uniref:Sigma-70 family RNA polymerase sigma factor n=1 Tax=Clostridium muellerianum TaxID=2716538 RepID=A0A7Y0EDT6_9CLOT|nr:sigma-70 family RNA polymerase sigma factor [Clostridium muellerianum]NMM61661.1 sigma-70 family RNA polymerase sigma factor [Clostridium muellerianum]
MKIDESNYISELKRKNSKALEYTYSKYVGLVYKVVFDLLKDTASRQDVEECVSDIFISLWKNAVQYNDNITTFKKWLVAISKYKAIDYIRKLRKAQEIVELKEDTAISNDNIEEKIIQTDDVNTIVGIIKNMSEIDKRIFFKRYILNENINNIAEYLKLPRTVIDNRLSRGRKLIKNKWEKLMGR